MDNPPDGLLQHIPLPEHRLHGLERIPLDSIFDLAHKGLVGKRILVINSWLSFDITLTQQTIFDVVNCLLDTLRVLTTYEESKPVWRALTTSSQISSCIFSQAFFTKNNIEIL